MSKRKEPCDHVDPVEPNKKAKKEEGEISDSDDEPETLPTSECKEVIAACLFHASQFARLEQRIIEATKKHNLTTYQILLYVGLISNLRGAKIKAHIAKQFALSLDVLASVDDIISQMHKTSNAGNAWYAVIEKNKM